MPSPSEVHAYLQAAFRSRPGPRGIFSRRELGGLQRMLADPTATDAHVAVVVEEFRAALSEGRLMTDRLRRHRIDELFTSLHGSGRLPATLSPPAAGQDWVDALTGHVGDPPTPPPRPLDDAYVLGKTERGELVLDGRILQRDGDHIDLGGAYSRGLALDLLIDLWVAVDLTALPSRVRHTLAGVIVDGLQGDGLTIPTTGDGKLRQGGVTLLAALLLGELAPLDPVQAKIVLMHTAAEPRPAISAALAGATPEATADPEGLALLERVRQLLVEQPSFHDGIATYRFNRDQVGAMACALSFCGGEAAATRLYNELLTFALARGSEDDIVLDDAETQALVDALEGYIDDSEATVFQFGLWTNSAIRAASDLTHALAAAPWAGAEGSLLRDPPSLARVQLTSAQASWLLTAVAHVRDPAAATQLEQAVRQAAGLGGSSDHLTPTAFVQLQRALDRQIARSEGSTDGRSDLAELVDSLDLATRALAAQITLATASLAADPPHLDLGPSVPGLQLDLDGADLFREMIDERLGSERSLPNLAISASAFAREGVLVGPEREAFAQVLQEYLDTWPDNQTFDFNKLQRLSVAAVTGNETPLCRINGRAIDPGEFHTAVGRVVRDALTDLDFPWAWVGHRFGYRAKQAAELIDLLAERAKQGKGPIASLRRTFPEPSIHCVATTSDLEYNALIFRVELGEGPVIFYMDSEGGVHEHERHPEPKHVLFEAEVDADGHVHVRLPERLTLSTRAYPLMNTYGLGDRIDVEDFDEDAEIRLEAKERFETRYRVSVGTIVAFDDVGNHTVRMEDGTEREVDYNRLRMWNNPHVVSELDGEACTARFRREHDPRFAADLATMSKIANQHGLPEFDLALSEATLANTQKAFLRSLNQFTRDTLRYPSKPPSTPEDTAYHDGLSSGTHAMGDYLEVGRGVCRHQFIREHMGKQRAGIDERFASGAANTYEGAFRGLHIWGEVSLADRSRLAVENPEPTDPRYLSDPTWHDPYIPLWDGAYGNDLRRIEMYDRTDYYAHLLALDRSVRA